MSNATPLIVSPSSSPATNLDSFIVTKRATPEPLATSPEIRDRGSIFVASIYAARTPEEAKARVTHVKHIVHRSKRATHEMSAWRCMVLKHGRTGLEGLDDFELVQGSKDDGESWAGGKILKVMQNYAVLDAVVIVSRWYGGSLLGPARFTHIETCASEVCKEFKKSEELRDCITTLRSLDEMLNELRNELAAMQSTDGDTNGADKAGSADRILDYTTGMDLGKANRLIHAREKSIATVRTLIAKRATDPANIMPS